MANAIAVNQITFALPSRQFVIHSSVTVNESLPKVTEFALRLVRLCEELEPEQLAGYFGFTSKEARLLLESLTDQSLVEFDGKVIRLTPYAESKFYTDDDLPRFSVVKPRVDSVDFDLLTFHPVDGGGRRKAPPYAVELPVAHDKIGESAHLAEQAYQKHFQRILKAREKTNDKIDIYKISNVKSDKLFGTPLEIGFFLNDSFEVERHINYEDEAPQEYRLGIEASVSDTLKMPLSSQHAWLAEFVERFDDRLVGQYLTKSGFDFSRYIREAHIKKEASYSGATEALIGNFYMPANAERISSALVESLPSLADSKASHFLTSAAWLAPDYQFWGRSSLFEEFYFTLQGKLRQPKKKKESSKEEVRLLYPGSREAIRNIQGRFWSKQEKSVHFFSGEIMGGRVEVLVVPTCLACVLFHYATPGNTSALVPFGFMSRDPDIIKEAQVIVFDATDGGRKYEGKAIYGNREQRETPTYEESFNFLNYCNV